MIPFWTPFYVKHFFFHYRIVLNTYEMLTIESIRRNLDNDCFRYGLSNKNLSFSHICLNFAAIFYLSFFSVWSKIHQKSESNRLKKSRIFPPFLSNFKLPFFADFPCGFWLQLQQLIYLQLSTVAWILWSILWCIHRSEKSSKFKAFCWEKKWEEIGTLSEKLMEKDKRMM